MNGVSYDSNRPPREPWTCRLCYEDRGKNVKLDDDGISFDNRSVEAKVGYRCPECGHKVVIAL